MRLFVYCGGSGIFPIVGNIFPIPPQLPGGQIGPSDNLKKMSQGSFYLNWLGMGMPIPMQKRNLGASIALRELQCTLAAKAKRSIALLFGLESKNVIK